MMDFECWMEAQRLGFKLKIDLTLKSSASLVIDQSFHLAGEFIHPYQEKIQQLSN